MHLADLLRLRTRPAAGLLLALTDRCPLSCAHCSTRSGPGAPQYGAAPFLRFAETFTAADRPEAVLMSGGEPLLRPALVAGIAARCRAVGARTAVLSGMFFARDGRVPPPVLRALAGVDHFSASLDAFHEREVPRAGALAALETVAGLVPEVSVHITSDDDAYTEAVLADVRAVFGDRVPALVGRVQPTGRARAFTAPERAGPGHAAADPCEFAQWPLLDIDGTVLACPRQSLARRHRPRHLIIGHAERDGWPEIRRRSAQDAVLRAVRVLGPVETARRTGSPVCDGYCATCVGLGAAPEVPAGMTVAVEALLDGLRPRDLARRWGAGRFGDAVELGWRGR
ncbi:radical SAM protein [Streptomyces sp. RFCAC02]|uniref:radical SAM protein n=1 Tax=Streptomyces sp. RFCAC02 TaxID=2499143 RepID=UPI00101FEE6E|nr:radical SAM protein [Streptomyces sp. RFCAC02]